jgi:putative membrane protein
MQGSEHVSEHLANERTYLAFLRTAVSIIGFGITINRTALFLLESRAVPAHLQGVVGLLGTERLGSFMVLAGIALLIAGSIQFQRITTEIEDGSYRPRTMQIWVTTFIVTVATVVILLWLIST